MGYSWSNCYYLRHRNAHLVCVGEGCWTHHSEIHRTSSVSGRSSPNCQCHGAWDSPLWRFILWLPPSYKNAQKKTQVAMWHAGTQTARMWYPKALNSESVAPELKHATPTVAKYVWDTWMQKREWLLRANVRTSHVRASKSLLVWKMGSVSEDEHRRDGLTWETLD